MGIGGVLLALSAVQAVSQVGQGYAEQAEAKFNASLYDSKAQMIQTQEEIEYGQYERLKGQYLSKSYVSAGKAGIMPTGSLAAVMVESQKQIGIDQAISKFNYETEKTFTRAQADAYRRQGKQAVYAGYSNAFSTMLSAGYQYSTYKKSGDNPLKKKTE